MSALRVSLRLLPLVLVSWFSSSAISDDSVGFIPGEFSVNEMGAATYSIPIEVPPGINGLQPNLALVFDSQSGNGDFGVGFSLSGLASVSRCPTELYYDDIIDGVDYDDNDKFCFNGERLIPNDDGAFTLRTDSNSKFYPHESVFNLNGSLSPLYWEMRSTNGISVFFGVDEAARVIGTGMEGETHTWRVSSSNDQFGNSVTYHYGQSDYSAASVLEFVVYGENDQYQISFSRESRQDSIGRVVAGSSHYSIQSRVHEILVSVDGELNRKYSIDYDYTSAGYSYPKAINSCSFSDCLEPTSFQLTEEGLSHSVRSGPPTSIGGSEESANRSLRRILFGDFNGDGITDLYRVSGWGESGTDHVYLFNSDGGYSFVPGPKTKIGDSSASANRDIRRIKLGDFNGDGITDVYRINGWGNSSQDTVYIFDHNGNHTPVAGPPTPFGDSEDSANRSIQRILFGDFNGDGITDVYRINGWGNSAADDVYLFNSQAGYSKKVGPPTYIGSTSTTANRDIRRFKLGDFNGDGITDLYRINGWGNSASDDVYLFESDGSYVPKTGPATTINNSNDGADRDIRRILFGDFNGDGITDVYRINGWGGSASDSVYLFKSDGGFVPKVGPSTSVGNVSSTANRDINRVKLGDFNGDGITDVYRINGWGNSASDDVYIFGSDGSFSHRSGPSTAINGSEDGANRDISRVRVQDFNGDGITDIYRINGWGGNDSDSVFLFMSDGSFLPKSGPKTLVGNVSSTANRDISRVKFGDFNGDGVLDIYRINGWDNSSKDSVHIANARREITSLNTGLNEISWSTKVASKMNIYSSGEELEHPVVTFNGYSRLVDSVSKAIGPVDSTVNYTYKGYKFHREGLGSLGFRQIQSTDETTGIRTVTTYSQNWEKHTTGMVESSQTIAPDGTVLSEAVNQLENRFEGIHTDRYLPYIRATTSVQRDLNGSIINTTTLEHELNDSGWVEKDTTCVSGLEYMAGQPDDMSQNGITYCSAMANTESLKVTDYTYYPESIAPDFAPLLERKTTSITIPNAPPFQPATETRVVAYDYDFNTGQLKSETIEPDNNDLWLTKTYTYHSSGQPVATEVSGAGIETRTTSIEYNPVTLLPIKKVNAKSHQTTLAYEDSRFPWLATKITAPDGNWVKTYFNSWGAKERSEKGHGSTLIGWTETENLWCEGDALCDPDELFYTVSTASLGMPSYAFYDELGREVRRLSYGLHNGAVEEIEQRTGYNERGLVDWAGHPYYVNGGTEYGDTTQYDLLGRPIQITDSAGEISSIDYQGLTVVYTDPNSRVKTVIKNALGQQVEVRDNRNNPITYAYDAFGKMVYMNDHHGNETKIGFNVRGFKTLLDDPDQGVWIYEYDALGKLTHQTNANNQTTYTTYDVLGRMKSRTDDFGTTAAKTSNWYYDDTSNSAAAIGKLTYITDNADYAKAIRYDDFGRANKTITKLDGKVYVSSTTYDSFGRVENSVFPTGYTVSNLYHDQLGGLSKVVKADGDTNPNNDYVFWEGTSASARGQEEQALLGGFIQTSRTHNAATGVVENINASFGLTGAEYQNLAYQWDAVGNVESFNDQIQGLSETYVYDDLYRLNDVIASTGSITSTRYDQLGNITSKSGVGNYSYDSIGVPSECGTINAAPGPHAVRRITGTKANYYCYDNAGNMVKDKDRTIHYTSYNKPHFISRGSTTVNFKYGPDRSRYKRVEVKGGATSTTFYLGNYEKVIEGGSTKHKIVIGGVAQVIEEEGSSTKINYFLKDHLGSITSVVNHVGTAMEQMSFDAWGSRRFTNLMLITDPYNYENDFTDRGFAGHEHIDSVGLIHMNGRIYDPVIGRFLSADPLIQAPSNLQSLNRYSYVMNNPLSLVDPSGYGWLSKKWKAFKKRAKRFVTAAVAWAVTGQYFGGEYGYNYRKARELGLSVSDAHKFGAKTTAISAASKGLPYGAGEWLSTLSFIKIYGSPAIAEGLARIAVQGTIGGVLAKAGGGSFYDGAILPVAINSLITLTQVAASQFSSSERLTSSAGIEEGFQKSIDKFGVESGAIDLSSDLTLEYQVSGPKGFSRIVRRHLLKLNATETGGEILRGLAESGKGLNIYYNAGQSAATFRTILDFSWSHTTVAFDPRPVLAPPGLFVNSHGNYFQPMVSPTAVLGHELVHAWQNVSWGNEVPLIQHAISGGNAWERQAVAYTNRIRQEQGLGYSRVRY